MAVVVWGVLEKSQVDNETIEEAVARLIQAHEDDANAHVEIGESLYSHKAAAIIDHLVASIVADKIKDLEVTTAKLDNLAVTEAKIGSLAVTNAKIGSLAVTELKIGGLAVTEGKLGNLAVSEGKLGNLAVSEGKLGNLSVAEAKIQASAVSENKIADFSVTNAKIGNLAVTNAKINDLSADKITAGILTGRTIRTAAAGIYRLEIHRVGETDANYIKWYNSSNNTLSYFYGASSGNLTLYAKNELQLVSGYNDIVSQDIFRPFMTNALNLGTSSYYWSDLYINYLRFGASYGYLYHGATLLQSYYSYATSFATRIRLKNLASDPTTNKHEGQMFMETWDDRARLYDGANFRDICYYDERNDASPIPTFVSGLEQLKKIKEPVMLAEKGLCFDTLAFPEEFKVKRGPKQKEHIDLKKVVGMNIQVLKELDKRVEDLEQK